ncbi:effector-associated domain EAD1-containing protein [Streptomyces uncialis]|uniref:effector-associated domain EAD1-containing protein n=1 Tax=Streptomyces uncialis TaxID=1048205 RepID=UPI003649EDCE
MSPGSEQDGGPEPLRPAEISALTSAYRDSGSAELLLGAAGFPPMAMPAGAATMGDYWRRVSAKLAEGVMADGRRRILAKARSDYPYQPLFRPAATDAPSPRRTAAGPGSGGRTTVMLLGAEPARIGATRAAAELSRTLDEGGERLDLRAYPAATAASLDQIRRVRPDILHLACHGEDESLILEDPDGEAHRLSADDLAATLHLAAEYTGHRLRALVLRSCGGERIAERFLPYADVVIAHHGPLDGECSVLFAAAFYRELAALSGPITTKDLHIAARLAAQSAVNRAAMCRTVATGLLVLPQAP